MISVKYNRSNIHGFSVVLNGKTWDVRLLPGHNDVDAFVWEEAKKNKLIKHMINDGILVEVTKSKSFGELTPAEQKEIIKDTFDLDKLESYKDFAKGAVRTALNKQIDEILEK